MNNSAATVTITAEEYEKLTAENEKLKAEVTRLQILKDRYEEYIRLANARRFGASTERSELPGQLGMFNEAEAISSEAALEEVPVATHTRKKHAGKREELWEGIPTEQIVHELPEAERVCPDCGGALHACGHEVVRTECELIPTQVRKVEHVQTVYSCRHCEANAADAPVPMMKAAVPASVIAGSGIASASLVSHILCGKYALALPLYRQEQEFKRMGLPLSRQTMSNWVIYAANRWLMPMYELLRAELLKNEILHADETTVQVIREDGRRAEQKSYMWMYHTPKNSEKPIALFEYQPTRKGEHPQKFLKGFKGFLHVDAYAGYKALETSGVTIVECWAHARRKFTDVLKSLKQPDRSNAEANVGIAYIDKLFALEKQYDVQKLPPGERSLRRNVKSRKVLDDFYVWAQSQIPRFLPKTLMAEALRYALNQRKWLEHFMLDGRLELSNNRAERSIRPFTVGRKNWLFSMTPRGADASAAVYSLVETAYANGLVPFAYLSYLLQTLPNLPTDRFHECLPWLLSPSSGKV
jgi:transposase